MNIRRRATGALAAAAAVGLAFAVAFAGCALPRSGTLAQSCTAAQECDDDNPCTEDSCSGDGACVHLAISEALEQTAGDCRELSCQDGQPTFTPVDDPPPAEPCHTVSCDAGEVVDVVQTSGSCTSTQGKPGTCNAAGECDTTCDGSDPAQCDDENPCTVDSCDVAAGKCLHSSAANDPLPPEQQVAGDCLLQVCSGGMVEDLIDNSDLPVDGDPCTQDLCNGGVPSNPLEDKHTSCTGKDDTIAMWCDMEGNCVECLEPSDCVHLPGDTECRTRTCTAGICGQDFEVVDHPLEQPGQILGDCLVKVCDGAGGVKDNADDNDLPDDNNDCTKNQCLNGVKVFPNEPDTAKCGVGMTLWCDGLGACVGCTKDTQCAADTFCRDWFCNQSSKKCATNDKADNTPLPANQQTPADCKELRCNGAGGVKSANINDPILDGNQCTDDKCTAGVPSNPATTVNAPCTQNGGKYCDGAKSCVQCNLASQCSGAVACQTNVCNGMKKCQIDPLPKTTLAPGSYQTAKDCKDVMCDGVGGVDVANPVANGNDKPVDGNQCTQDVCTGTTPSNPAEMAGTMCTGGVCNGMSSCVECLVDGDCAMNEKCYLPTKQCRLAQGQMCTLGSQCASNICKDGVCCDAACGGTCEACDLAGKVGICSQVPDTQDPDNECAGGSCNGSGACLKDDGTACGLGSECRSTICTDGYCCDAACSAACQACDVSGKLGVCSNVPKGTDPHTDCGGGQTCDGAGACKKNDGEGCGNGTECLSGFCVDGKCCDKACGGTCEACDLSSPGVCTLVPAGQDPDNECMGSKNCDGNGACEP